jgi:hypothetical protein
VGLWRVGAVATRRGAGRPAAARKTSIFSLKKKHKSINTKKNLPNFVHMNSHQRPPSLGPRMPSVNLPLLVPIYRWIWWLMRWVTLEPYQYTVVVVVCVGLDEILVPHRLGLARDQLGTARKNKQACQKKLTALPLYGEVSKTCK